jgi:hypothetical protein
MIGVLCLFEGRRGCCFVLNPTRCDPIPTPEKLLYLSNTNLIRVTYLFDDPDLDVALFCQGTLASQEFKRQTPLPREDWGPFHALLTKFVTTPLICDNFCPSLKESSECLCLSSRIFECSLRRHESCSSAITGDVCSRYEYSEPEFRQQACPPRQDELWMGHMWLLFL